MGDKGAVAKEQIKKIISTMPLIYMSVADVWNKMPEDDETHSMADLSAYLGQLFREGYCDARPGLRGTTLYRWRLQRRIAWWGDFKRGDMDWVSFRMALINLRGQGLFAFVKENARVFQFAPKEVVKEASEKYSRLYPALINPFGGILSVVDEPKLNSLPPEDVPTEFWKMCNFCLKWHDSRVACSEHRMIRRLQEFCGFGSRTGLETIVPPKDPYAGHWLTRAIDFIFKARIGLRTPFVVKGWYA